MNTEDKVKFEQNEFYKSANRLLTALEQHRKANPNDFKRKYPFQSPFDEVVYCIGNWVLASHGME